MFLRLLRHWLEHRKIPGSSRYTVEDGDFNISGRGYKDWLICAAVATCEEVP